MDTKELIHHLVGAQVASCSCFVKPPDIEYHAVDCRYRLFAEAEAKLRRVGDLTTELRRYFDSGLFAKESDLYLLMIEIEGGDR